MIPSKSTSPFSKKSTWLYVTPNSFKEPFSSLIPITPSNVSYGLPVTDNISSPGLSIPCKQRVKAWVPLTIIGLTNASSAPNTFAYISSTFSRPKSL